MKRYSLLFILSFFMTSLSAQKNGYDDVFEKQIDVIQKQMEKQNEALRKQNAEFNAELNRLTDEAQRIRWEKMQKQRADFYAESINLSAEEAQFFWPEYNRLQEKIAELHQRMSLLLNDLEDRANNRKDINYTKITDEMINLRVQESALEKRYHERFKKILPPEKLYNYYRAERHWANKLLRGIQKRGTGKIDIDIKKSNDAKYSW